MRTAGLIRTKRERERKEERGREREFVRWQRPVANLTDGTADAQTKQTTENRSISRVREIYSPGFIIFEIQIYSFTLFLAIYCFSYAY